MAKNHTTLLTKLKHAIQSNNTDKITALVKEKNINSSLDNKGNNALHLAIQEPNIEVVELLLNLGANVNLSNNENYTPLHMVAYCKLPSKDQQKITQLLLKKEPRVNSIDCDKQTPLHIAVIYNHNNFAMISELLEKGANPNIQDYNKQTVTHLAASKLNCELIKLLLQHEADITIKNKFDETPLQYVLGRKFLPFNNDSEQYIHTVGLLALLEASNNSNSQFSKLPKELLFLIAGYIYIEPQIDSNLTPNSCEEISISGSLEDSIDY